MEKILPKKEKQMGMELNELKQTQVTLQQWKKLFWN
jgi:hypothetical protein